MHETNYTYILRTNNKDYTVSFFKQTKIAVPAEQLWIKYNWKLRKCKSKRANNTYLIPRMLNNYFWFWISYVIWYSVKLDKEKVALYDRWLLKRCKMDKKYYMTGKRSLFNTDECLIEVTTWTGFTVQYCRWSGLFHIADNTCCMFW